MGTDSATSAKTYQMDYLFLSFLLAVALIAMSPGPAMMFCMQQSQRHGLRTGLMAVLGVEIGVLIYIVLSAYGLGTFFKLYPSVYNTLLIGGALYLIYLAITTWPRAGKEEADEETLTALKNINSRNVFLKGLLINLTNPKIVLFFVSLIPQFVPDGGTVKTFLFYGLIFNLAGWMTNGIAAVFSAQIAKVLQNARWLDYLISIFFVGLALHSVSGIVEAWQ